MIFLGIESSCDDTGVALYSPGKGVLAERLASSGALHQKTCGIVPEVAARDHSRKLLPLVTACLQQTRIQVEEITAIGYTRGPGLIGALMVGAAFAKSLAFALGKPTLGVHHLEGHLCSVLLDSTDPPQAPFLALLVSGGHSHLFLVEGDFRYRLLGATRDDAAGEAFDKCAAMLGLGYPGGAPLSALAQSGDPLRFSLPRPMVGKPGYDFSFSGLKTAVRYCLADLGTQAREASTRADLAAGVEAAIVDCLLARLQRAVVDTGVDRVVIAGGVSANLRLRTAVGKKTWRVWLPSPRLCTDNGAMIACAVANRYQAGFMDMDMTIEPMPVWPLEQLHLMQ